MELELALALAQAVAVTQAVAQAVAPVGWEREELPPLVALLESQAGTESLEGRTELLELRL